MTQSYRTADDIADAIVSKVGKRIVLGLPVGIGKAVHIADALFDRAAADTAMSLSIFTGLTLELPRGRSELERRFLNPFVERQYARWPTPKYAHAVRKNNLPSNIRVREFYLRPGAWLGSAVAQQNYASINYSQVVDELLRLGVNVIAQLIASRPESPGRYSLSSNPEITLDLLPHFEACRTRGAAVAMVGQINRELPYMSGDAEIDERRFDFVLDDRRYDYPLFGLPNRPVAAADYATAMHVASLVPDGGMLQIGIGSLSDAVAHCLRLRHEDSEIFREVLRRLPGGASTERRESLPLETGPFDEGLYSSTELLSDALFSLFERGIIRRPADGDSEAVIHAGFFIGSSALYESLRELNEADRPRIAMTRISFTNTLYGDEERKRRQRRHARFVNETMLVTLLGAAASDSLADGRIVSGVGGQFDFVSMAHDLDDAQSILMVRARRLQDGKAISNIRWSYAEATVPRHHRDIFVSEYGIAATRGQTDAQVIDSMLSIADSAFQADLREAAQQAGKLPADHSLRADATHNTPEAVCAVFDDEALRPYFPAYPLGTDLTAVEQELADALGWLKNRTAGILAMTQTSAAALVRRIPDSHAAAIARLGLDRPAGVRERLLRRLVSYALSKQ